MSNYATLKSTIQSAIKTNGNNEITGALLQSVLNAMVVALGNGYQYAGVATASTAPGTPDQRVFYFAASAGTYSNFNNITIALNEIAILRWDTSWHKDTLGIASERNIWSGSLKGGNNTWITSIFRPALQGLRTYRLVIANPNFDRAGVTSNTACLVVYTMTNGGATIARTIYTVNRDDICPKYFDVRLLSSEDSIRVSGRATNGESINFYLYDITNENLLLRRHMIGLGSTQVFVMIDGLKVGRRYRLRPFATSWDMTGTTSPMLGIQYYNGSSYVNLISYSSNVPEFFDFVVPSSATLVRVIGHAAVGVEIGFEITESPFDNEQKIRFVESLESKRISIEMAQGTFTNNANTKAIKTKYRFICKPYTVYRICTNRPASANCRYAYGYALYSSVGNWGTTDMVTAIGGQTTPPRYTALCKTDEYGYMAFEIFEYDTVNGAYRDLSLSDFDGYDIWLEDISPEGRNFFTNPLGNQYFSLFVKEIYAVGNLNEDLPQYYLRWWGISQDGVSSFGLNAQHVLIGFSYDADNGSASQGTDTRDYLSLVIGGKNNDTVIDVFKAGGVHFYVVWDVENYLKFGDGISYANSFVDNYQNWPLDMSRIISKDANPIVQDFLLDFPNEPRLSLLQLNHKSSRETLDRFNLLFFSDVHASASEKGDINILKNILAWGHKYTSYIDDILHGGDIVADNINPENLAGWNDSPYISTMLNTIGNHDCATRDGSEYIKVQDPKTVYDIFFAPYIANWGVVQPANAAASGLMYYYKDYTAKKIRLVVLDCMYLTSAQEIWLASVLTDARNNDYSVICCQHYDSALVKAQCSFNALLNNPTGTLAFTSQVQDFIDAGGKFICWLTGHTHRDYFGTVSDYPQQTIFTTRNAGVHDPNTDAYRNFRYQPLGVFNIFNVCSEHSLLTIKRFGLTEDEFLQSADVLVYDYANHVVKFNK